MMLLEKGDFLFSFDLKSGYHHIDKERDSLRFFGAGADSTATGSGATRAGELAPSGRPVRPASQPSGGATQTAAVRSVCVCVCTPRPHVSCGSTCT